MIEAFCAITSVRAWKVSRILEEKAFRSALKRFEAFEWNEWRGWDGRSGWSGGTTRHQADMDGQQR